MSRDFLDGLFAGAVVGFAAWVWLDAWCQRRRRQGEFERRLARLDAIEALPRPRETFWCVDRQGRVVQVPELNDPDRRSR